MFAGVWKLFAASLQSHSVVMASQTRVMPTVVHGTLLPPEHYLPFVGWTVQKNVWQISQDSCQVI